MPSAKYYVISHGWLGVVLVAISTLIMAYSGLFSVVPILVFFALWLPLLLIVRGAEYSIASAVLLIVFPLFALASSLWSPLPSHSAYLAVAMLLMLACVYSMCRVIGFRAWLRGLLYGGAAVLCVAIASNDYAVDGITRTPSLAGMMGSKNMVGFFSEITVICAAMSMLSEPRWRNRIAALCCMGLGCAALYLSHSATSLVSLLVALAAMGWAFVVFRASKENRKLMLLASLCVLMLVVGFITALGGGDGLFSLLGKDVTLTGRTYLWQEGLRIANERVLLGHGYGAFWVEGQPDAERLWDAFFILDRKGFHFHNCLVQALVDLGVFGVAIIVALMVLSTAFVIRAMWVSRGSPESVFLFSLMVVYLIREWVEVDILGPFGIGVMLFYSIAPRALGVLRAARADI